MPPLLAAVSPTPDKLANEARRVDAVSRAEADLKRLVERRARAAAEQQAEEEAWRESTRRHSAKLRRQHRAEWFAFYSRLSESLRRSAEHFEAKAQRLLEEDLRKEKA